MADPDHLALNPAVSRLLEFCASLRFEDLPEAVVMQTKQCFLDCLGVALYGVSAPPAVKARALASRGARQASVWGTDLRATVFEAAVINGCAAHALDYDDSYAGAVPIHSSATLVPALLAIGEARGLGGRDLVLGFVVGAEVGTRLGEAIGQTHYVDGWHSTGTIGTLGAAVGVGKLLGLPYEQLALCLGLGAVQAAGLVQATGTMCKPLNAGKAAGNGVIAAQLAEAEFTAPVDILDLPRGFGALFSRDYDSARAIQGLGERYQMLQIGFKPHACCRQTHATFDAVVEVRRQHRIQPEQIERIQVELHPAAAAAVDVPEPKDGTEAKFSLAFCVSLGLVSDDALPGRFTDAAVRDPRLRAIWPKVEVITNAALETIAGQSNVTIVTASGQSFAGFAPCARGRWDNPLSQEEIERKFVALAEPVVGPQRSARVMETVSRLEDADTTSLTALLAGVGAAAGVR